MLEAVTGVLCKFNWDWIKDKKIDVIPSGLYKAQALDPAISLEKGADYTAIVTGAVEGNRLIIIDLWGEQIASGQSKQAHSIACRWDVDVTLVETNVFQASVKYDFDKLLPRRTARGVNNSKNKELRIDGLEPFFREGDIWFYKGIPDKYFDMFKFEYCGYPLTGANHFLDALQMLVSNTIAHNVDSEGAEVVESRSLTQEWYDKCGG
jgi:hypothetical protein